MAMDRAGLEALESGGLVTAVPQLLHPETTALKWRLPQENATLLNAGKGT
jgi:hypothetical protein